MVQIYAKKIQEAVDPEKLAIIEEYNRFHLQYYKNEEGKWAERPIAIVAGIGDTGSGKETFYKKFAKYGLIPAITGTGGLTKDHEGFYQVYEQTMQGLKIVADNAGFINPMQAMSPIMLVALRRKMDQRGLQNVPMHLDGVIRSVEQARGIIGNIPKDKLRFYNLRINERVGFERLIIRLVSKYLNEQDLRKDDLADLLVDKNTGNSYTPKGFSQFVQTQVELLQKMASKEAKSMQDKRRVERAKKIQEQRTNPVTLGRFIAERLRTLNQGYLNPAGRFIKYNKNEFPKIANNLREAGFDIPVIYGDRLTIEETHDAMIATLGKDCFPKEALMNIAGKRKKEPVYMAYFEDRNTIIKLANNRDADMALDYAIQFARKKYLALREAFATKSEKRNGVYYEHKEGAFSAIDNKVVFSEVQNSTSTVLFRRPDNGTYELGVITGMENTINGIVPVLWYLDPEEMNYKRIADPNLKIVKGKNIRPEIFSPHTQNILSRASAMEFSRWDTEMDIKFKTAA